MDVAQQLLATGGDCCLQVRLNPQGSSDYFDSYEFKKDILQWFDHVKLRAPRNQKHPQALWQDGSFVSKYISKEQAESLSSRVTSLGLQAHDCILRAKGKPCIVAPDSNAFRLFPELLVPAIRERHDRFESSEPLEAKQVDPSQLRPFDASQVKRFDLSEIKAVKRVMVKVYRNIDSYAFMSSINLNELIEIEKLVLEFLETEETCRGTYYPLSSDDMPVEDKKWLFSGK